MNQVRTSLLLCVTMLMSLTSLAQTPNGNVDAYKATFKMEENQYLKKMTIEVRDGKLVAVSDARPKNAIDLTPTAKADTFDAKVQGYDAAFIFGRSKEGAIKSLKISIAGGFMVLTGEKEGSEYVSTFDMAENQYCKKIFIREKDGKLFMSADTNPNDMVELSNKSADVYTASVQNYEAEVSFTRTEGKVASIKISVASGQVVLTGSKEIKN